MPWKPAQYLEFADANACARRSTCSRALPLERPRTIVDLGCGTGNVTRILAERWPEARIVGVDNSPPMLAKRARPRAAIRASRLSRPISRAGSPSAPVDLVYSNAALHWLAAHAALFRARRGDGGARRSARRADARQFPRTVAHADHRPCAQRCAGGRSWAPRAGAAGRRAGRLFRLARRGNGEASTCGAPNTCRCCRGRAGRRASGRRVDQGHVARPVPGGARRSGRAEEFMREYRERLAVAYPAAADGRTLYPFRRLFIVPREPVRPPDQCAVDDAAE